MDSNNQGKMCSCPHHKMVPLMILLIGVDFLLGALNVFSMNTVNIIWPILVIIAGATKLCRGMCKCC